MNYSQLFDFISKFAEEWLKGKDVFNKLILKSLFVKFWQKINAWIMQLYKLWFWYGTFDIKNALLYRGRKTMDNHFDSSSKNFKVWLFTAHKLTFHFKFLHKL